MRILRVAVLGVLASCITTHATAPTAVSVPYRITQVTLASGLRAVSEVAPDFGTAGAALVVQAGSADEPPGKGGLAHLVEHLVFQGKHEGESLLGRLMTLGAGKWNGMTSWDQTTYFAFGPESSFGALASLLAEVVDDPLAGVDDATLDHERQVVLNELHSRAENGTPKEAFGLLAAEVFPPEHPYARPSIGTEDSIRSLTLADVRAFAKEHYKPTAAILALSSPVSFEEQRSMLSRIEALHGWPPATIDARPSRRVADTAGPPHAALVTRELNVSTPSLWVGWSMPSRTSAHVDAAQLLLTVVEGTFWDHVYDHDPDIAYVNAYIHPGVDASLFYIVATLKEGVDPQSSADSLLRTMMHGFGEGTYLGASLGIYKRNVATSLLGDEESIVSRTINAATSVALTGSASFLRSRADRIIGLQSGTVSDFYRRYLGADRAHVVLIRPSATRPERGSLPGAPPGIEIGGAPAAQEALAPSDPDVAGWMRSPHVAEARRATLDNGLEVVVVPRPGAPFHSLIVAYHGGEANEAKHGAAVASLWAKQRFKVSAATWGVGYWDRVSMDSTFETLRAAGSDLELTLKELANEHDLRVFWPPPQFSTRVDAFERQDRFPDAVFDRRLKAALFGAHPYGHTTTSADLRAVSPKDVYQFVDAIQQTGNGIAVLVGDVAPDTAMASLSAALGKDGGSRALASSVAPPPALEDAAAGPGERLTVTDRPGSDSGRMVFRCLVRRVDRNALGAAHVIANALQGLFFGELRSLTAESYAISTSVQLLRSGGAVIGVNADVDEMRLPLAVGAVRRWVEEPVFSWLNDDTVARARRSAASEYNLSLDTSGALAGAIVGMWNLGWPIDTIDRIPEQVLAARRDDLVGLLDACRANWVLGLLGNKAHIIDAVAGWNP